MPLIIRLPPGEWQIRDDAGGGGHRNVVVRDDEPHEEFSIDNDFRPVTVIDRTSERSWEMRAGQELLRTGEIRAIPESTGGGGGERGGGSGSSPGGDLSPGGGGTSGGGGKGSGGSGGGGGDAGSGGGTNLGNDRRQEAKE